MDVINESVAVDAVDVTAYVSAARRSVHSFAVDVANDVDFAIFPIACCPVSDVVGAVTYNDATVAADAVRSCLC